MIDQRTVIAANRFGLGARPGELAAIGKTPERWLRDQVHGAATVPPAVAALRPYTEVLVEFRQAREVRNTMRRRGDENEPSAGMVRGVRDVLKPAYEAQALARYVTAIESELPFRERLVHFWTNHFAVSAGKPPVSAMAGALENLAIRPHVTGTFADMLLAVESHPAMLIYLDNLQSVGPNARAAENMSRRGRNADINENLGREVLELHTLGVDGGYTQDDVIALSKILTGWTVGGGRSGARDGRPGEFHFREELHEPGTQAVMGSTYAQRGQSQGEAALHDLANHPTTARHLATKLVRHFVADDPPPTAVARVAEAFMDSAGDLPTAYEALIAAPEAWREPLTKYKSPSDYVISGMRALGVTPRGSRQLIGALMLLGQPPYQPPSPAGWPDTSAEWDGADALMARIEWANEVGRRAGAAFDPIKVAEASLGPVMGQQTRKAVTRAESRVQGLTLLFAQSRVHAEMTMRRRDFLAAMGSLPLLTTLPGIALARTGSDQRLVLVILRGAMDGLSAAPPHGDPEYARRRGPLAIDPPGATDGALDLDGFFGLHPELTGLHDLYGRRELVLIHALASPYRERSHFDGQDALENGTATATGARNGWLNRALGQLGPPATGEAGIALGQTVPLVLRGDVSVTSWAPSMLPQIGSDTLERIAWMYDGDPLLAERLQQALAADALADSGMDAGGLGFRRGQAFATLARAAGRFLTADDGPNVAVLESDGWDTHANQGARNGQLAKRLAELDKGLSELRSTLGDAWDTTVVVVVTEFGRTLAANGSRGTDHGTGSCAFVLGGPVRGGRVIADWPGLRRQDLYEGRDLMPATDLRAVFKGVLRDHLGLSSSDLGAVFPGPGAVAPTDGLV